MKKRTTDFLSGVPWAIWPEKLEAIAAVVEAHAAGNALEFEAESGKSGPRAGEDFALTQDGIAELHVYGVLARRMNLLERMSGGTSCQILARQVDAAAADPDVRGILLDVDSPGGTVDGTEELASAVRRAAAAKPVLAYTGGQMCSAAYWVASAAREIMAASTATVGSIGVAMVHYDRSGRDEMQGVKRTVLTAGKYKRAGSDEKALSEEDRGYLTGLLDDIYGEFVAAVAQGRKVSEETVRSSMAEGKIFTGRQAKPLGLVDALGDGDAALSRLREMMENSGNEEAGDMAGQKKQEGTKAEAAATLDLAGLRKEHPELTDALAAEAKDRGRDDERARVMEIFEIGGSVESMKAAVEGGQSANDFCRVALAEARGKEVAAVQSFEERLAESAGAHGQEHTAAQKASSLDEEAGRQALASAAQELAGKEKISVREAMLRVRRQGGGE